MRGAILALKDRLRCWRRGHDWLTLQHLNGIEFYWPSRSQICARCGAQKDGPFSEVYPGPRIFFLGKEITTLSRIEMLTLIRILDKALHTGRIVGGLKSD